MLAHISQPEAYVPDVLGTQSGQKAHIEQDAAAHSAQLVAEGLLDSVVLLIATSVRIVSELAYEMHAAKILLLNDSSVYYKMELSAAGMWVKLEYL